VLTLGGLSLDQMNLPVACSLTESELNDRRRSVLQQVKGAVIEVRETEDGYSYRFPSDGDWITDLAKLVTLERQCCPFLQFTINVEPGNGPVWLEMKGSKGTKEFLASLFD
jgi:hypothetical protein